MKNQSDSKFSNKLSGYKWFKKRYRDYSRRKPVLSNSKRINFKCDNCRNDGWSKISIYNKNKLHFCNVVCHRDYRKNKQKENLIKEFKKINNEFTARSKQIRILDRDCSCGNKMDGTIYINKLGMCGNCFDKFVLEPYDLKNRFNRTGKYR